MTVGTTKLHLAAAMGVPMQKKTVLITGVSRGLGRALALELARRGHSVIGCARSSDNILSLHSDLASLNPAAASSSSASDSPHLITTADVRSDSSIKELAKHVVESNLIPDIIVNNAGTINQNNKIWDIPAEEFDMVIDTNVKGTANILRHFLPLLIEKKHGIIVNMSSGWGRSASAEVSAYCATKWAVEGLTRSVAKELPPGLAVIALSPGVVNTDMLTSCFGSSASLYQTPESWAPRAATMILSLTTEDNGASLTV
ncbi:NAD(P)-binding Rossmann-fold superfamily protein [Rhynchospora pubera]|uniref:NAD(P)-binding Rossmann-fold superfamily protein n=1 Tax=Rhynchospora pubera TaxID=906938 RepID=A0AAV8F9X0_9POAL|nr:NAD(P)-binding Rossmann-fold superfamily protein [Rhynchospora pubera]